MNFSPFSFGLDSIIRFNIKSCQQKFYPLCKLSEKSGFRGVVLSMKKAIAAPGVGWFFPMKTGILPQAPGKKIVSVIFVLAYAIFVSPWPCHVQVGVDYNSSL